MQEAYNGNRGSLDIETKIDGSPQQCRDVGHQCQRLGQALDDLAAKVQNSQSTGVEAWQGKSGDHFYDWATSEMNNARKASTSALHIGGALVEWANDIDTAQRRMQGAIQAAHEGQLEVVGTVIKYPADAKPGSGQTDAGGMPVCTDDDPNFGAEMARYNKRQKAYKECAQTANEARGMERSAHERLAQALTDASGTMNTIVTKGGTALSTALAFAGGVNSTTEKFALRAATQRGIANTVAQMYAQPGNKFYNLGDVLAEFRKLGKYERAQWRFGAATSGIPKSFKTVAGLNLAKKLPILNKLGVLGNAVSLGSTIYNVEHGANAGKEWTKFGLKTGEGLALSGVAMLIPGPGWAYGITVGGGILLGMGTDYVVDHWDEIRHGFEQTADTLNRTQQETGIYQWGNHR